MFHSSTRARICLTLVSLLLLVPVVGVRWQNPALLEFTHGRTLNKWPSPDTFVANPPAYFAKAKAWLADRAYPIMQASLLHKKLQFFVLNTPPQRRVTMGRDGFIFLNGGSEQEINQLFRSICVAAHSHTIGSAVQRALPVIANFARSRSFDVDMLVFPTMATLYGDYLPLSVPQNYRTACQERTAGKSPLLNLQAPPGMHFMYPLVAMRAMRDDAAFFPKGNWHPLGLSLKTARDAYLAQLGVSGKVDEALTLGEGPSEIIATYGIVKNLPVYTIANARVRAEATQNDAFRKQVADLFLDPRFFSVAYSNSNPLLDESVLMISDSYGNEAAPVFAGAFARLLQVATNGLPDERVAELIDRVRSMRKVDRVLLLVQEGSVEKAILWSRAMAAAPPAGSAVTALAPPTDAPAVPDAQPAP